VGLQKAFALLLVGTALTTVPVLAQEVGTTTAVNPDSQSTPPGAGTVTLKVGARIVHKERIRTTSTGTVQLLFLDKSTLSIAPNTDILIDDYVYNPADGSGRMAATLTEGALGFVGGQLSHAGQATISTPYVSIGIRGGTAIVKHDANGTNIYDLYGVLTPNNGCQPLRRPSFKMKFSGPNSCGAPEHVTAAEIAYFINLFTSRVGENGGVPGLTNVLLNEFIGPPQGTIDPPPFRAGSGESNAFQLLIQATEHGAGRNQPPQPPPPPPPPQPPPPTLTRGR
jgi:hypothetical protein